MHPVADGTKAWRLEPQNAGIRIIHRSRPSHYPIDRVLSISAGGKAPALFFNHVIQKACQQQSSECHPQVVTPHRNVLAVTRRVPVFLDQILLPACEFLVAKVRE
jgi:hypothetical protein